MKCQILRIQFSTSIIPAGLQKVVEDNPRELEEIPEEERKPLTFEDLSRLDNWVHFSESILNEGRLVHFVPGTLPDDIDADKWNEI